MANSNNDISELQAFEESINYSTDDTSISSEEIFEHSENAHYTTKARKVSTNSSASLPITSGSYKPWDVFRITSRDPVKSIDGSFNHLFRKVAKVFTSIFLTVAILVCTMISKSTLLLITSNIYKNVTLKCSRVDFDHVSECRRVSPEDVGNQSYQPSQTVEVSWLWALFLVVCTPYLFTFGKCIWRICFKKTRTPTSGVLLVVLAVETLHTIGICIFVFYLLPSLDPIRGLLLTFGVAFTPAILKMFDSQSEKGRKFYTLIFDVLAFVVQLSILLLWPIRNIIADEDYQDAWAIIVSLLLISLGWWENYVNKFTKLGKLGQVLRDLKRNIRRMRTKTFAVVSVWKIVVTLGLMTALMSNLKMSCVKALFFKGDNHAMECPHLSYPTDTFNVESSAYRTDPFWIAMIQIFSCLLCYTFSKTACKIMLQVVSFSLPLMLAAPVMAGLFIGNCETWKSVGNTQFLMPDYLYWTCDIHGISTDFLEILISDYFLPITLAWWLSFMWVTFHIWIPRVERLVQTERLFVTPLYCGVMLEQSLMLNRRRDDKDRDFRHSEKEKRFQIPWINDQRDGGILPGRSSLRTDRTPMIYVCATMWHETEKEMIQVLTSIFRMDNDQCARKNAQKFFDVVDPDYYEFEVNIFFDDAFEKHDDDEYEFHVNSFVKQLVRVMDQAASNVHRVPVKIPPPTKYPTPYGGRLEWTLPGNNKLNVHLKDKAKIRIKKRWSQVMYMYYLLGLKLVSQPLDSRRKQTIADNSFILALDGDVDFKPSAVQLLVDRMKKNEKVGAACGRIHPIGTGPMIWYQKFEYAVSHWLQKATEHMIGCVLCSPGCFSLFRASALMDDNVMRKYATTSSNARHYVQFDQGEDRWLCTLLLQQGYRVEYSAAADALTYAPEGFAEFYNQRRRWSPSTMANIMDLLMDWKNIASLMINLTPLVVFLLACFFTKGKYQIILAELFSLVYALIMMVVVVGLGLEMKREGLCSPTTIFLIFIIGAFVISAIMHPQEFYCLLHGALYFLCIPSMSMLLMIYSICNLHVVSWGTRENAIAAQPNAKPEKKAKENKIAAILNKFSGKKNSEESDYVFSFGNLFKCLCCPRPSGNEAEKRFAEVMAKLQDLEEAVSKPKQGEPKDVKDAETNVNDGDIMSEEGKGKQPLEETGIRYNPIFQSSSLPYEEDTPFWIHDDDIGHGKIRYISKEEKAFWNDLIKKYLYPLQHNEKHKKKTGKRSSRAEEQDEPYYSNARDKGSGLSIPLPCRDLDTGKALSLEPISMLFMAIFGIALVIQFISMFFHRLATFLHIMSSTEVNCMKPNQSEVTAMDIASKVQLVKEMQRFEDDEDTRSISTISSDIDEDSSVTQDDSPKIKRKKTILKITRRKRGATPQSGNLSGKFLTNFMEMAKDLEKGESGASKVTRRSKKRSKNAKKAMDRLEQNKDMVLNKAHVIKSRWQRLAKASKWDSNGDKWGSLLRLAMGQSRTSLNTISEDDKRSSWARGISKAMRSNSEFSINTLPDLGSWSVRNSYAEPILNIITDQLENEGAHGQFSHGHSKESTQLKTKVEINAQDNSASMQNNFQRHENVYDRVKDSNSDSESDSVYDESDLSSTHNNTMSDSSRIQMSSTHNNTMSDSSRIQMSTLKTTSDNSSPIENGDTHL
ncbi:hypothetical protein FSP39_013460 [Pinctada imbricata]|uniref:chitin synthase n=1 Tax=Pinctada imbricata TaxID=66713 RepID=A0AA88XEH8_PINIB|nr:hypothetical protein FSP39_013460 [Pinctada imbricata]